MKTFAIALVAAALAVPAPSFATDQSSHAATKPTSFVPRSHEGRHVYGSPIGRPIVGRPKTSNDKHIAKKAPRPIG